MSIIAELDDHCFVLAIHAITELCTEVEKATGEKPTIDELCELLAWGLRGCTADILSDVNPSNVIALNPKLTSRKKVTLKPGDLVAIPASTGMHYLAVFITKNTFGHAFGALKGQHPLKPPPKQWKPAVFKHPVYSGDRFVASGRWHVIANCSDLLKLFPKQPELFYDKEFWKDDDQIGPHGSGESPNGAIRDLTKAEAREIGLLDGTYKQGMLGEEFEAWLAKKVV